MLKRELLEGKTTREIKAAVEKAVALTAREHLLRTLADEVREEFKGKGPHLKDLEPYMEAEIHRLGRDWCKIQSREKLVREIYEDLHVSADDVGGDPIGRMYIKTLVHLDGFIETELTKPEKTFVSRAKKSSTIRHR